MEMSASQLAMRMLSSMAQVDQTQAAHRAAQRRGMGRLTDAIGSLNEARIHVDETAALNALELRARARRMKREYGKLGLVVVDYLQLMSASRRARTAPPRSRRSRARSRRSPRSSDVPVIALSQLSRAVEQRNDRRPLMSDLRESGAIEQDADVILFIYREEVYAPDKEEAKGRAEVIIGKQRNGPIGTVHLTFLGALHPLRELRREAHHGRAADRADVPLTPSSSRPETTGGAAAANRGGSRSATARTRPPSSRR